MWIFPLEVKTFGFSSFSYAKIKKEPFKLHEEEFSRAFSAFLLIVISLVTIRQRL